MSKRMIAPFVLAMAVTAIPTVEMTCLILGRFVLHNCHLPRQGGLSPAQDPNGEALKIVACSHKRHRVVWG
jgi:hypothetical protein